MSYRIYVYTVITLVLHHLCQYIHQFLGHFGLQFLIIIIIYIKLSLSVCVCVCVCMCVCVVYVCINMCSVARSSCQKILNVMGIQMHARLNHSSQHRSYYRGVMWYVARHVIRILYVAQAIL